MGDTKEGTLADFDAKYGDLSSRDAYAWWVGRLSVALELALRSAPADNRVARETLAAYRTAVNMVDAA